MNVLPETLTPAEVAAQEALYGPFTQHVRELVDAVIRTEVDDEVVREIDEQVQKLTARLRERQIDGAFGIRHDGETMTRPWGNAVIGLRNALAPPLEVVREDGREDGRCWAEFELGAAYEGPPGLVHGGVTAMLLDHVLGQVAGNRGKPRMTASLTLRYLRPTPLGPLRIEGRVERVEGYKTFAVGHIRDAEGPTVEASGVFVLPRGLRDEDSGP